MPWLPIALRLIPLIFGAVNAVEHFLSNRHGPDKQNAAVDMVSAFLIATEGAVGRDLLNDNDVRIATKEVIDAVVALQNVIASRPKAA
ncbi:MAG: hypothetical protein NUW01_19885 [Gemmatimonadaceae bacterium]|nr:hypothetical protein [Gemmatimonadaceae bacterium]